MVRVALVTATSLALTGAVVAHAYILKQQFYPAVVYLGRSSPSMAVLYLQGAVLLYLLGRLLLRVFFGSLRAAETERLVERCGYAVTETCVAFAVFRDDASPPRFVALFALLLFLKCFHWLAEDRVDTMERSPHDAASPLFHLRVRSLLSLLAAMDALFVRHAWRSMASRGPSVQLVFGLEYAVLLTMALATLVKYLLHSAELRGGGHQGASASSWDDKAVYMLYTELVMGGVTALLHLAFIGVMLWAHSFPLFATRPLYLALRTLRRAATDVVMSRRAVRHMNAAYPDATAADLRGADGACVVCREEMAPAVGGAKKLPCGHIFHGGCLRSWFQRQRTCPICRADVLRAAAPPHLAHGTPPALADSSATPSASALAPGMPLPPPGFPPVTLFPVWDLFSSGATPAAGGGGGPADTEEASGETLSAAAGETLPSSFPAFSFPPSFHVPPAAPLSASSMHPPLTGLSEEERLQCLQDIYSLLDAAMLNIHYYLSSLAATAPPPPPPPTSQENQSQSL